MPRTLPWLKGGGPTDTATTTSTPRRQPASKRRRISTPPALDASSDIDIDLDDNDDELPTKPSTSASTPSRRRLLNSTRTPSTSPPPAPPDLVSMREGYNEDDIWMMVEDEFYTIAQAYTQHLHHAEYQRLKSLAREREQAKESRGHGTDGRSKMSAAGARSLAREAREKNVSNALKKLAYGEDDDIEDDDPWLGTQLAGLMTSPRKVQKLRARGMGQGRSDTRAARGFARSDQSVMPSQNQRTTGKDIDQQAETTDDGDSDDLDAPSRHSKSFQTTASTHEPPQTSRYQRTEKLDSFEQPKRRSSLDRHRVHATANSSIATTDRTGTGTRHREVLPPKSIPRTSSTIRASSSSSATVKTGTDSLLPTQPTDGVSKFARRRAEREKARLEREKKDNEESVTTEIPTFLF